MLAAAQGSSKPAPPPASSAGRRLAGGKGGRSKDSQLSQGNSQDISQGGYSQGPLTQGGLQLSQGGGGLSLSQGMGGLSQGDLSQDSLMQGDLHSQLDGLLSQDSTYQGDRFASQHQYLSQFSQVCILLESYFNLVIIFYNSSNEAPELFLSSDDNIVELVSAKPITIPKSTLLTA